MFICQEKIADTENCVKIFFWQMGIDTSQMKQLFLYGSAAWVLPKGLKCAVYDIKKQLTALEGRVWQYAKRLWIGYARTL